jgi:hypothetical protein
MRRMADSPPLPDPPSPASEGLRRVLHELSQGRWKNIRKDLESYLAKNAARIVGSAHFRRALRLAGVPKQPVTELAKTRSPRLEYALYLAAFGILSEDNTISSRDEFTEQNREIHQAIWTLGETLQRPPTQDEIRERIDQWLRESAAPQREKIVLVETLLMRSDWPSFAPILWKHLDESGTA